MKILISGAGIGGLTAALCLQKAGHEVLLFEQASEFHETGAGLQCGANALAVFDWLGLLPQLEPLSVAPERVDFCDYQSGRVLYSSQWGQAYKDKYGYSYWHLHRADLHRVLHQSFKGKVYFNAHINAYQENGDSVSIELSDGRRFSGDLLIGADGIKSKVRAQLIGDCTPSFTGNVAWRGVIPSADLPPNFMDKAAYNYMGQGKHMVVYYVRGQQLINFVGVVQTRKPIEQSWVRESPWEDLNADFADWHPNVQLLVEAMKGRPCYRWGLFNHQPLKSWSSERVTLLGDAAHATLPFMASGAAMAIEDARILQRALDENNDLPTALECYQENRIPRTRKVQVDSIRFGKLYHLSSSMALTLAFKALKSAGKRKESFLPSYDANTIKLIN